MSAEQILAAIAVGGGLVTILGGGGVLGWWWRKQPQREEERQRNAAVADAILGEPAVLDRSNQQIQPPRPGLVHRVGTVEEAVIEFRSVISLLTELQKQVATLDSRLAVLEHSAIERALARHESAEMWRAVANRDVIDGQADDDASERD